MTTMTRTIASTSLALAAVVCGTSADAPSPSAARVIGGYHALAGDFHVHSFPSTWSTLSPMDTVLEARHRGLDVIAMTPHDSIWAGKLGAWFSRAIGGPIVIASEEITARRYHLIGVGMTEAIPHGVPLADAIARVHGQGGVAIVVHPYEMNWLAADAPELAALDGAEIVRSEALVHEDAAARLHAFFARGTFTAIGSSDYHGLGPVGYARTWVFARERTEQGVIEALRDGRTVVYGRDRAYGDPALIALAAENRLPHDVPPWPLPGALGWSSRAGILAVLAAMLLFNRWSR
jgi:predicted metal-dependent phosphoesterase TrpH